MFTQNIHDLKPKVSVPTQHLEVLCLLESNEEDVYETPQGGYLPAEVSDDDFQGKDEEEDFWREKDQVIVQHLIKT